ncbi:MAG TPA: glutamine amidotransferase [Magnetospirillum sp.]|nr:glutamine amidotransferase [Magnetospirillum sp.]
MKTVFAIRHVAFEDLGSFAPELRELGYQITYHEAGQAPLDVANVLAADLLVVLGGPMGVYDGKDYPWLSEEIETVAQRLSADAPTLGICLGSQIMAAALGAKVFPGGEGKEIGWGKLHLTDEGHRSALAELSPEAAHVLHWHGDTFELPDGASLLAGSDKYPHQAFSFGRSMALQFHPEVTPSGLESWFIGHTLEISTTPGIDVPALRAATAQHGLGLMRQGRSFLRRWLSSVA